MGSSERGLVWEELYLFRFVLRTTCAIRFKPTCLSCHEMKVIDDSFYFGVEEEVDDGGQFPTTYPFSATVPEIGLALLKVRQREEL